MKKLLLLLAAVGVIFTACEKVDLSDIYDRLDRVENQLGISHDFNNKIYYTTSDNTKLFPKTDASLYGAILISNTYKDGQGVLVFDDVITTIGSSAFSGCTSLTSITIPDSVTSIGSSAFDDCTALTEVIIPDSVTEIGSYAFDDCTALKMITIGTSVATIGNNAFENCPALTTITIPNSVTEIGYDAFRGCMFEREDFINNSSLDAVANYYWGAEIYDVVQTDGLCINGTTAVYCKKSATNVTIPNSVTSIGYEAFFSCTLLTSVTIPDSVTSIGDSAFSSCESLTRVDISDLSAWCKIGFGDGANPLNNRAKLYLNGSELTDITIPSDITEIKKDAFQGFSSLTSVTIHNRVTKIGQAAFQHCNSLTNVTISDSVTSIGRHAFEDCTSLTSITIGNSVTSIGYHAFWDCTSLKEVYCKPTTPPAGNRYMFNNNASGLEIYVPRNSVSAYKSAEYWSTYASYIEGYDF